MTDEPVLYLNYGGVLHPADVHVTRDEPCRTQVYFRGQTSSHPLFEHAKLLEELLEPFPALRVVLASSWVKEFGYDFALR